MVEYPEGRYYKDVYLRVPEEPEEVLVQYGVSPEPRVRVYRIEACIRYQGPEGTGEYRQYQE
jgi:hypothetical protein